MLRNIFSKIFFCVFLFTVFFGFTANQASALTESEVQNTAGCNKTSWTINVFSSTYDCGNGVGYSCSSSGGQCKVINTTPGSEQCIPIPGWFSLTGCLTSLANLVLYWIIWAINTVILRPLIWLSSLIFDFTVYFTIVKFKTNFSDLRMGGLGGIALGSSNNTQGLIYYMWGMIRDFLNIIIFIAIIYHAVVSMFEGFTETRKKFIGLLVFSIVANFSLLFVKIAIDVSNILALQAYTLAVQPQGVDSFSSFRTSANNGVNSFGEYIRTSVDLEKLMANGLVTDVAKVQIDSMQGTFMFQIGRMIVFVGIIYIMLYLSGLLIARGLVFLLAMIASPLIAADIFFKIWGMDQNGATGKIIEKVREITKVFRGDFYDALIKGPVLIFAVFLIGVLAESIFSSGIVNSLQQNIQNMDDVKAATVDNGPFIQSLFIFFKFAMFFILCQILFKLVEAIKIDGADNSGTRLNAWGNRFVGRGLGALGWAGRNTVGRVTSSQNNVIGRTVANLNNRFVGLKNSEGLIKKNVGRLGLAVTTGLTKGSFDGRNVLLSKGRLGNLISKIGIEPTEKTLGAAIQGGYQEQLKARQDKAAKKIEEDIENAGKGLVTTKEEKDKAKEETKITDTSMTLAKYDELMSNPDFAAQMKANPGGINLSANGIDAKDLKFLLGASSKDPEILNKIDAAREKAEGLAQKKTEARAKEMKDKMKEQVAQSIRPGATFGQKNLDRTGSSYPELLTDAISGNRGTVREGVAQRFRKESVKNSREEAKKFPVVREVKNEIENTLSEVKKALGLNHIQNAVTGSPDELIKNELLKKKTDLEAALATPELSFSGGQVSEDDRKKIVEKFTKAKDFRGDIIKLKNSTSDLLSGIYESTPDNNAKFDAIKAAKDHAQSELETHKQIGPTAYTNPFTGVSGPRAYASELTRLRNEFEKLDKQSSNRKSNFDAAQKIAEKAKTLEEKMKTNFEPKPAEAPKPDTKTK